MLILTKLVVFLLFLSILIIIKEFGLFLAAWFGEVKFAISTKRLWLLACAISYICTIIFTGTKLI